MNFSAPINSNNYITNFFLLLFSILPLSFITGSAILEINIILIDISFITLIIINKKFQFIKSKPIIYLLILYAYLIFNSLISINIHEGLSRNLGFLRFIILFSAFNYFFLDKNFYSKIFKLWTIFFFIVSIDVFIEQFSGKNILGFNYGVRFIDDGATLMHGRIVSFFKDEPIVGGFINGFYLILIGFFLNELKKNKLNLLFPIILMVIFFAAIMFSGERSNTIKAFLGLLLFIFFMKQINYKKKLSILLAAITFVFIIIINMQFLSIRYVSNIENIFKKHTIYFDLYYSGFHVFKNNKFFGVGNKNYRVETCSKKILSDINKKKVYHCNNHPHQIYLELLSEHGLIGTLIILFILFKLIFSKILKVYYDSNYLKIGSLIYMIFVFTPLIPSGAFFSSNLITIFMLNLSIFYAVDQKSNIFNSVNYK